MRHENLRVFLKVCRHNQCGYALLQRGEGGNHIATHVELDLAGDQQQAIIGLRPAGQDGHIKAVFLISAICHSLIKATMLCFGEPIATKGHLVEGLSRKDMGHKGERHTKRKLKGQFHRTLHERDCDISNSLALLI